MRALSSHSAGDQSEKFCFVLRACLARGHVNVCAILRWESRELLNQIISIAYFRQREILIIPLENCWKKEKEREIITQFAEFVFTLCNSPMSLYPFKPHCIAANRHSSTLWSPNYTHIWALLHLLALFALHYYWHFPYDSYRQLSGWIRRLLLLLWIFSARCSRRLLCVYTQLFSCHSLLSTHRRRRLYRFIFHSSQFLDVRSLPQIRVYSVLFCNIREDEAVSSYAYTHATNEQKRDEKPTEKQQRELSWGKGRYFSRLLFHAIDIVLLLFSVRSTGGIVSICWPLSSSRSSVSHCSTHSDFPSLS